MARTVNRRGFIKGSLTVSVGLVSVPTDKEKALLAKPADQSLDMPMGKIRHVKISCLICGGNLIIGSAHDRDLIYVASLMRHYFTDRKIIETWQLCEDGVEKSQKSKIKNQNSGIAVSCDDFLSRRAGIAF